MNAPLPARVVRARLQLMLRHPYLAVAVARLPLVYAIDMPWCDTMATDGYYIYINGDFCSTRSDEELVFVFAHETMHCVLGHIDRREHRNRGIWNLAVDFATNCLLVRAGMEMPSAGLYDRRYSGMIAEEIYLDLYRANSEASGLPEQGRITIRGVERDRQRAEGGFDLHIDPGDQQGQSRRVNEFPSSEERRRLRRSIVGSIGDHLAGREAGYWQAEIQAATERSVPWKVLLAQFVGGLQRNDYRLYPFNKKHLWRDCYLPTVGIPGPDSLVVVVDTSGSIANCLLSRFLAELDGIRSVIDCKLTLIQCDTVIQAVDVFEAFEQASYGSPTTPNGQVFRGRGGTDLRPPFEWVEKQVRAGKGEYDAVLYFTDGFGPIPKSVPQWPVLWVMPGHGRPDMPFGQVVRLRPSQTTERR